MTAERVQLNTRVTRYNRERARRLAAQLDRSLAWIIDEALDRGLEDLAAEHASDEEDA